MATYASGSIHFSGLGSDTDFDTMIKDLYKIESKYAVSLCAGEKTGKREHQLFKK